MGRPSIRIPIAKVGELYSVNWDSFDSRFGSGLRQLHADAGEGDNLGDVTLGSEGQFLSCHKVILSLCSPYFKRLFQAIKTPSVNTVVLLEHLTFPDLQNVISFIYNGSVQLKSSDLNGFLKATAALKIQGLDKGTSTSQNTHSASSKPKPRQFTAEQSSLKRQTRPETPDPEDDDYPKLISVSSIKPVDFETCNYSDNLDASNTLNETPKKRKRRSGRARNTSDAEEDAENVESESEIEHDSRKRVARKESDPLYLEDSEEVLEFYIENSLDAEDGRDDPNDLDFEVKVERKAQTRQKTGGRTKDPVWAHFIDINSMFHCKQCSYSIKRPQPDRLKKHLKKCNQDKTDNDKLRCPQPSAAAATIAAERETDRKSTET